MMRWGWDGFGHMPSWAQARVGAPGIAAVKSSALRILEERYVRGEIEQERFLRRKADLSA